jgi:hypothetical protein
MCGEFCTLPALFLKIIFNFSFFESAWLFCLGTLSIGVPAAGLGMNSSLRDPAAQPKNGVRERERSGSGAVIGQAIPASATALGFAVSKNPARKIVPITFAVGPSFNGGRTLGGGTSQSRRAGTELSDP